METLALENIGLTNAEIKIYLSLLELGQTKVGSIIEKSGLQSSVVHNTLNKLKEKGIISYIKKDKIKHYNATSPNNLIGFIEEKKKQIQKILPELLLKQKLAKGKNEAEVYQGTKGITNLLLEFIEDGKKGDEFLFFAADVEKTNEEIQDFYKKYDPKRKNKGLIVKGIVPSKIKHLFKERIKQNFMEVKFTSTKIPPNMGIFRNKICMLNWGEKPIGYIIHSKQIAKQYKEFFNSIWDDT